jgi:hypothetical protein
VLGSEVAVNVEVSTLISWVLGLMVGERELMSSPPAGMLPITPRGALVAPGEAEEFVPLLAGDREPSNNEGGAASTSKAFSRIDLPSLYF